MTDGDKIIRRKDLQEALQITRQTMWKYIKYGTIPQPDVKLSRKTMVWRLSTLREAGINIA